MTILFIEFIYKLIENTYYPVNERMWYIIYNKSYIFYMNYRD
ncbi:hypothetical protein SAMN05421852_12134 [Thermoflavimicrobium dichotomicum]|uniref:Uncharacterized protein n=1 Tax=Thermoflavimicrobium dichotomicum TaxID=46223 RepID=A0A1I3U2P8_9BACL|nr:hypothetical protein SAMN05421852_12134 [Thermoflavimicrobium dichotomicum]